MESAGLEPTELSRLAVEVMRQAGLDISHEKAQSVLDPFHSGMLRQQVIFVCETAR